MKKVQVKPFSSNFSTPNSAHPKSKEKFSKSNSGDHFENFCDYTSLHGWQYIPPLNLANPTKSAFWLVIVVVAFGASLYFTLKNFHEYLTSRTITTLDSSTLPLSDVNFPAFYACNLNQVSSSFLASIGAASSEDISRLLNFYVKGNGPKWEELKKDPNFEMNMSSQFATDGDAETANRLKHFIERAKRFKSVGRSGIEISFEHLVAQNCSDQNLRVRFDNYPVKYFYDSYIGRTDAGKCCWFHPAYDFSRDGEPPRLKGVRNGIHNSLEFLLDLEAYDYAFNARSSTGWILNLGERQDKAVIMQTGFFISPGSENLIALSVSAINTTERALEHFNPEQRGCYREGEFPLRYLSSSLDYRYSLSNCLYEAMTTRIERECGCTPSMFQKGNFSLRDCVGVLRDCVDFWLQHLGSRSNPDLFRSRDAWGEERECLEPCEDQKLHVSPSYSVYPNRRAILKSADYCVIAHKILVTCRNPFKGRHLEEFYDNAAICATVTKQLESGAICPSATSLRPRLAKDEDPELLAMDEFITQYARDNVASTRIYFKEPFYTGYKRDQAMTFVNFIANAGGLVGLCMGLSFVSVVEVFYHVILCCCTKMTRFQVFPNSPN